MRYVPLLLVVLIISAPGSIGVIEQSQRINTSKMSSELLSVLDSEENIEAIVQFHNSSGDYTWERVESIGIEVISKMSILHGGLITGSGEEIAELSTRSFVSHIEANVPIEHFYLPGDQDDYESMMHETVRWVNASLAWHRAIIGTDGVVKTESDLSFSEYDGKGATAVDLDTGVDGEHPDFDCGEPWTGEKLIWSAKWTGLAWVDAPNCNSDIQRPRHSRRRDNRRKRRRFRGQETRHCEGSNHSSLGYGRRRFHFRRCAGTGVDIRAQQARAKPVQYSSSLQLLGHQRGLQPFQCCHITD